MKENMLQVVPRLDETSTTCIIMHEIFVGSSGEILQAEYHFTRTLLQIYEIPQLYFSSNVLSNHSIVDIYTFD